VLTLAKIKNTSASYEFVIHIFEPLMVQLSPSFIARAWRANASEPEAGSDRQKLPSCESVRERVDRCVRVGDGPLTQQVAVATSPVVL
jgi:hypothetical protein